mmetsp:Transcript_22135/g.48402  ORF Transcript_22135/g.48402 Transcript_22135/m.48402 type:complete len:212 (+) Transcript_22135:1351-1986(+)
MLQSSWGIHPPRSILLKKALHERSRTLREGAPPPISWEFTAQDCLRNLHIVGGAERRPPQKEHIANNAKAPQITLTRVFALQHLWTCVVQGSARHVQLFLLVAQHTGEAEVDELQSVLLVRSAVHPVLQLQIPMDNSMGVQVADSLKHLGHDAYCVALSVELLLAKSAVQLATAKFHDQPDTVALLVGMQKPADVRVVQAEVDFHLILQQL